MNSVSSSNIDQMISDINHLIKSDLERVEEIIENPKGSLSIENRDKCLIHFLNQGGKRLYLKLFSESDSPYVKRFYDQVKDAWHIPGVIDKGEFGSEVKRFYIIEEEIEGQTLNKYYFDDELDAIDIIRIFKKICLQLDNMHSLNPAIVHADLKPENIIMRGGEIYLIDFEFAYIVGDIRSLKGRGTPGYTAPEIINGKLLSPATDIYSLGKILKEWETKAEVLQRVNNRAAKLLNNIIDKCTKDEPAERYPDVKELIKDFSKLEVLLILDKSVDELTSLQMKLFSERNAGDDELRTARRYLEIEEDVLYLIENDNKRQLAFTESGIYPCLHQPNYPTLIHKLLSDRRATSKSLLHSKMFSGFFAPKKEVSTLTSITNSILYSNILCVRPTDEHYLDIVVFASDDSLKLGYRFYKMDCQGVDPSLIQLKIINEVIKSRENLFSDEMLTDFYRNMCKDAQRDLSELEPDEKIVRWQIIILLGTQAGGKCNGDLADVYESIGEYYRNSGVGDAHAKAKEYWQKAVDCGSKTAISKLEKFNE